jgi:Fe-S-cluster containining protein
MSTERQDNFFNVCGECKIHCCRGARPPITDKRRKTIEDYLKRKGISIENPFAKTAYTFPREDTEGYCVFYDKKTKKCRIHPVKPETCVAGPITFDLNMKTRKIEWYLKMEKICPLAGILYKNKEALQKHLESAKKEVARLVRELSSGALKAILKIDEPETFKIDEDKIENVVYKKLTS